MKLSDVLKVFGTAAVIAGLTPYRVTKNERTGEKKIRALFWEVTSGKSDDIVRDISVNVGFFSPLVRDDDEAHLFADELTVEYSKKPEDADAFEEKGEEANEEVPAETAPDENTENVEKEESAAVSSEEAKEQEEPNEKNE